MIIYGILILAECTILASTSAQVLHTECGCYGIFSNTIDATCANTEQIAINKLYYAAKTNDSGCPIETTIFNIATVEANGCCDPNPATDCVHDIQSDTIWGYQNHTTCIGKSSCQIQVTWMVTPASCSENSSSYLAQTNFMCLEYYCVPKSDIAPICDQTGSPHSDETTLYVSNNPYTNSTSQSEDCCSCRISTNGVASTIRFTSVDIRLNETSACTQSVLIKDGTKLLSFECDNWNRFRFKHLYTTTDNSTELYFKANGVLHGYLWLQLSSTENITIQCSDTGDDCPTTTTTYTTVSPAEQAASKEEPDCFMQSGFPVLVALIAVCVAAVIGCVLSYRWGMRRAMRKIGNNNSTAITPLKSDNQQPLTTQLPDTQLSTVNSRFRHLPPIGESSTDV